MVIMETFLLQGCSKAKKHHLFLRSFITLAKYLKFVLGNACKHDNTEISSLGKTTKGIF